MDKRRTTINQQIQAWRPAWLSAERSFTLGTALVSFFLSRAVIYGAFAPFGAAFLPTQHRTSRILAALAGSVLGSCTVAARADSLRYIAAAVIIAVVKLTLRQTFRTRTYMFSALVTLISIGTTGTVWLLASGASTAAALFFCAELLLAVTASCVFVCAAGSTGKKRRGYFAREKRMMAIFATMALCVSSIPPIEVGEVSLSLGRMAAGMTVIAAAYASRLYGGIIVGLIVGLAMDLTTAVSPIYTALYALAGLAAGLCARMRHAFSAAAYFVMTALTVALLPQEARLYGAIHEAFASSAAFCLVPRSWIALLPRMKENRSEAHYEARLRRHMQAKLHGLAEAYEDVAKTVGDVRSLPLADETEQFAIACEMVCGKCEHWQLCCQEIAHDKAAIRKMLARGCAEPADFCTAIRRRCPQIDAFCTCVTFSLRAGRERNLRNGEHAEAREMLSKQYGQIAALLDCEAEELSEDLRFERQLEQDVKKLAGKYGVAAEVIAFRDSAGQFHIELCAETLQPLLGKVDELTAILCQQTGANFGPPEQLEGKYLSCLSYAERPEFSCQIGATAEKRRSEAISGDCGTYFRGKNGSLCVILCDGMGSGTAAREEAVRTVKLLESFLKAGIDPAHAAEIVRSSVQVRSDSAQFATIDIAVVDPVKSELHTIKFRAAPTYLRRKRGEEYVVRVLGARSGAEPESLVCETARLVDGDMIVMTSDGVTAACTPRDFCTRLTGLHCDQPRELSELILKTVRTDGEHDDRTVIALYYGKTELTIQRDYAK